jgi:hypothetical protein
MGKLIRANEITNIDELDEEFYKELEEKFAEDSNMIKQKSKQNAKHWRNGREEFND